MAAESSVADEPVVVTLDGELDAAEEGWSDEITGLIDAGHRRLVVDLLNVTFIDSSVVRTLVNAHRAVGDGGWIRVVFTHHLIRRVIEICGLSTLMPQYTTVESALRGNPSRQTHTDESARTGVKRPASGHTPDERPGNRPDRGPTTEGAQ